MNSRHYPKRNEIYIALLPITSKSVQYGKRPVLIVQNDVGNDKSPTTIVAPLTSRTKKLMPTHVLLGREYGLVIDSVVLCEQLVTISSSTLSDKVGEITDVQKINEIDEALRCSLALK